MDFEDFCRSETRWWRQHLSWISGLKTSGRLVEPHGCVTLFPNILLLTNCRTHYVCELLGVDEFFTKLTVKHHHDESIYRFLNQFDDLNTAPILHLSGGGHIMAKVLLARHDDREFVKERFPIIDARWTEFSYVGEGRGSVLEFSEDHTASAFFDCVFVNRKDGIAKCKCSLHMNIVSSKAAESDLVELRARLTEDPSRLIGIYTLDEELQREAVIASQLISLVLQPGLRETTFGKFIAENNALMLRAFGASKCLYEWRFDWFEGSNDPYLRPDLVLLRENGSAVVIDLKTALMERRRITIGKRQRRRLLAEVNEGVAQLSHYREYFADERNADAIASACGRPPTNFQYVLVVGSLDNVNTEEVKEALRSCAGIDIVDFDSLVGMFLKASEPFLN